jgi:hypothetical protein
VIYRIFTSSTTNEKSVAQRITGNSDVSFPSSNAHLYRQFVSRGLYSLMLEHWYKVFPSKQIKVICTESISVSAVGVEAASNELRLLARFIGLEDYDFASTVSKGKFNTAHNRGYDLLIVQCILSTVPHLFKKYTLGTMNSPVGTFPQMKLTDP